MTEVPINAPFLLEKVPDVATWYATVRANNPNASVKNIVKFVKKNHQMSRESYEDFQRNVRDNVRLMATAMRVAGNYKLKNVTEQFDAMWKDYSDTETKQEKHELDKYLLPQILKNLGINK